jgi:hypothetical protein
MMITKKDRKLTQRTIEIINKGGIILLKKGDWYIGSWTNLAAGPDSVSWSKKESALQIFNLKWAFAIAPLYGCKVVVSYPKPKRHVAFDYGNNPIDAGTGGDPSYNRKADGSRF